MTKQKNTKARIAALGAFVKITPLDLAQLWGVTRQAIYYHISAGHLPKIRGRKRNPRGYWFARDLEKGLF